MIYSYADKQHSSKRRFQALQPTIKITKNSAMIDTVKFNYPLKDQQCGAVLGNGYTGELLWGEGNILNVTIGCTNLWDHRGGMKWTAAQNFEDIRSALAAADEKKIRSFFYQEKTDGVLRPSLIPVGRLVITLPEKAVLLRYEQHLTTGQTRVFYEFDGKEKFLDFFADFTLQDAIACRGLDDSVKLEILDSYYLSEHKQHRWKLAEHLSLAEHGFIPPEKFSDGNTMGFIQQMPADPSFALFGRKFDNGTFTLCFKRNVNDPAQLTAAEVNGFDLIAESSKEYFTGYWQDIPHIRYPDQLLERVYYHNLFKYAIITNPQAGLVPGLQAAWIEDDSLPPWQGDYHFNINIQMYMLPGLKSGKFANLKLLFDMILSWKDKLRQNARCFARIDNGYMLPHAVDDRATCMGGFWTGSIDHGCSSWVAQMMFDYCDYSGDLDFLRNEVYDFMLGVLRVFEVMMERDENGKLSLPVTISPEYRGAGMDAWGKNSSFHLAAVHQLAKNIIRAAEMLGIEPYAGAVDIRQNLPLFSSENNEIALWEGLLLEESHRHHSHLAGIYPFEVVDPLAPEMQEIIQNSIERLTRLGMGEWVGWCMPWASQLYTRCANPEMAELILKIWQNAFNNAGGASLHDGRYKGLTIFAQIRGEVMQIDGGMGAITAIQDQFMHVYDGELRVFYGISDHHTGVSFDRMFAPGGFRVSGRIDSSGQVSVEVIAAVDSLLKIRIRQSRQFTKAMKAGETLRLQLGNGEIFTA